MKAFVRLLSRLWVGLDLHWLRWVGAPFAALSHGGNFLGWLSGWEACWS